MTKSDLLKQYPELCMEIYMDGIETLGFVRPQHLWEHYARKNTTQTDWEILSFKVKGKDWIGHPAECVMHLSKDKREYICEATAASMPSGNISQIPDSHIHSVKRLSDNTVWCVGEETESGVIMKFSIESGTMKVPLTNGLLPDLSDIKRPEKKQPLFVTVPDKDLIWQTRNDFPITTNPLQKLREALCFTSRDVGEDKLIAFMYGVIVGWDDDAYAEFKVKLGWKDSDVALQKEWHQKYNKAWNLLMESEK